MCCPGCKPGVIFRVIKVILKTTQEKQEWGERVPPPPTANFSPQRLEKLAAGLTFCDSRHERWSILCELYNNIYEAYGVL